MTSLFLIGGPDDQLTSDVIRAKLGAAVDRIAPIPVMDLFPEPAPIPGLPALENGDEGVDTSHNQKKVIWQDVKVLADKKFAINKASEGWGYTDPSFLTSHVGAFGVMRRGAYHFFRPDLRRPADQARNFLAAIRQTGLSCDLMPYLANYWVDLEDPLDANAKVIDLAPYRPTILPDLKVFVDTLVGEGIPSQEIGFYTRCSWFNFWLPATQDAGWLGQHDLWAAGFPYGWPSPTYKVCVPWPWQKAGRTANIWQWDGATQAWTQNIPGIDGHVDKDRILNVRPQ